MFDLAMALNYAAVGGLDTAMRAAFGERISGLSYNGSAVRVHFYAQYTSQDETDAQAVVDAHDPVFLTATRDGDEVTVDINKPRNLDSAMEVTLTIDGMAAPDGTALTGGSGQDVIVSADPITIGVQTYPYEEATA